MPLTALNVQVADLVSSEMWSFRNWRWTNVSIASGTLSLSDGVQDYSPPPNIKRLMRARIVRTDVTPNDYRDLDVEDSLVPDLAPHDYSAITAISHEDSVGQLRLEYAVSVPSGVTLEIQGEYQVNPGRISTLTQGLWFPDEYLHVFVKGLMAWVYQLGDDSREGSAASDGQGKQTYAGQYGKFRAALYEMARAEDLGADEQMFPESTLGEGRFGGNLSIYGI
jgi:hypothetical protein